MFGGYCVNKSFSDILAKQKRGRISGSYQNVPKMEQRCSVRRILSCDQKVSKAEWQICLSTNIDLTFSKFSWAGVRTRDLLVFIPLTSIGLQWLPDMDPVSGNNIEQKCKHLQTDACIRALI
jgi:hypothetical protein